MRHLAVLAEIERPSSFPRVSRSLVEVEISHGELFGTSRSSIAGNFVNFEGMANIP